MERLRASLTHPAPTQPSPTGLVSLVGYAGWTLRLFAVTALLSSAACSPDDRTELIVATDLPEALRDYVERSFEETEPAVDVRFVSARGPSTADGSAGVDVWWGAPAVDLQSAADDGLLLAHRPSWVGDPDPGQAGVSEPGVVASMAGESVPGESDSEGSWHPTLVSPFVIAFNRERLTLARAPADWIDLFHFRWNGEVQALDPSRSLEGAWFAGSFIVEALRDDDDLNRGFDWLARLDGQVEVYRESAEDIIRALGTGDALLGIVPRYAAEAARFERAPWLYYRLPESSTPVLVQGVAIMADTDVEALARRFVDHLGRTDVTTEARLLTHWQPAYGEVDATRLPEGFEIDQPWTPQLPAPDTLAAELPAWIMRWETEVRGRSGVRP